MTLCAPDYAIITAALAVAIVGAFGGFSGALALLLASVGGGAAAKYGWALAGNHIDETWSRVLAVTAATLVAFCLVRTLVRKLVSGLLAQPADAIFGFAVGAITGAAIAAVTVTALGPDYFAVMQGRSALIALLPWQFAF